LGLPKLREALATPIKRLFYDLDAHDRNQAVTYNLRPQNRALIAALIPN
jgi:hypothetical protein